MTISEDSRHELYQRLEQALGDAARRATLMEYLPPVGWADVATKRDLEVLEHRLRADVRAEVNSAVTSQTWTIRSRSSARTSRWPRWPCRRRHGAT